MGMSAGGGSGFASDINVTPMVDIMLVLLIIFMVITPFLQQGVSVALPRDMRSPDEDQNINKDTSVVLAITQDNRLYIGKKQIEKTDLKAEIDRKMETKKPEERIVYIRSDVNSNYGSVVDVINTVRESGIDQIGLVADKRKGAGSANPATGGPGSPATTAPAPSGS